MLLLIGMKQILAWLRPPLLPLLFSPRGKHTSAESQNASKTVDQRCLEYAWQLYPLATDIRPLPQQGGCSHTLIIKFRPNDLTDDIDSIDSKIEASILQFRSSRFALDLTLCRRVHEIYAPLVSEVISRGRLASLEVQRDVYKMSLVPGVRFDGIQPHHRYLDEHATQKLQALLLGLARFFAAGFRAAEKQKTWRHCSGNVGFSLLSRLKKLSTELPSPALRARANATLSAVESGALDTLPVVLTHGDLLPSNIMVDPDTWRLTGLVDWAEAEDLLFGIGLYGVEHLYGYLEDGRWVFYEQAAELRDTFWNSLSVELPELEEELERSTLMAKDVGILLWHGFAWDDGRIDRVVNEKDDAEELVILRAFLDASGVEAGGDWKRARTRDSKIDSAC